MNSKCEAIAIKPDWGFIGEETEVWIKGTGFPEASKMLVLFGETASEVSEVYHSVLLTTRAPARITSGPVVVSIVNKEKLQSQDTLESLITNTSLTFTFRRK